MSSFQPIDLLGEQRALNMLDIVQNARLPLCITDPNRRDNPIVFINTAFTELTGYSQKEALGRNCRFLQGPDTSAASIARVREIISERTVDHVDILNYRKDGSTYINSLQIGPIYDSAGKLAYYFGSQLDVTQERARATMERELSDRELVHRLSNIVTVMLGITRITARNSDTVSEFSARLGRRLRALSDVHFASIKGLHGENDVEQMLRLLLCAYAPLQDAQFDLSGPSVSVSTNAASPLSLAIHELATNALKYGAFGADGGRVSVSWTFSGWDNDARLILTWREFGGPHTEKPDHSNGTRIIASLIEGCGGEFAMDWQPGGLVATIELPLDSPA